VKARKLDRLFRFVSYQRHDVLKYSLGVANVHWISLRPELEGLIVPSKFYGIAAAGRPMIAIGDKGGEIARLLQRYGCGMVIEPGDGENLADVIVKLFSDDKLTTTLGRRAREMLDGHFTRQRAFERWRDLLNNIM
jgi:glycosyltransferase involved in cell wall biosynthesis